MDRRRFLRSAGLGFAATGLGLTWPGFLSRAFGDEGAGSADEPRARTAELAEAIARARRDGKPLLVLVVPAEVNAIYSQGHRLGELINHGGTGVLDDLLVCELACATLEEARRALPLNVAVEPAMLLVELDSEGGEFLPATAIELPTGPVWSRAEQEDEAGIRARIAKGAAALHTAVLPSQDSLARRTERARVALGEAGRAAIDRGLTGRGAIDSELARRGAPVLITATADASSELRARARVALDAGAASMVKVRPAGAQWAHSAGCGVAIEGAPAMGVRCGMGCVPVLSQRFLHFYTTP